MDLWGFSFWNIPHFQTKQTWTWREFLSSFEVGEHFASETAKNELCWYSPSQNINCCCLSIYISTMIQGKKPTNLLQGVLNKWWWSIHRVRKKEKLMKQKSFQSFFWVLLKKRRNHFLQPITHPPYRGTDIPWPRWSNQKCPQDAKGRHPPRWSKSSNNLIWKSEIQSKDLGYSIYPTYISIPTRINVIHIHNTSGGLFNILHKLLWKRTAGSFFKPPF